jgi:cellulose synthase/poly-beta-1,6-N-acetylglucosamine synthase-like glycosyltransferase
VTTLTQILFFVAVICVAYVYFGYPLVVLILSMVRPRPVHKKTITPSVTVLIAAYNEAECIAATIENKLGLDFPKGQLEIIVVSDGSTDGTDEIVRRYEGERVRLIRQEPRAGKTSALNKAVSHAKGEILVFSDANSSYAPDALRFLIENFNDPKVGYVTGKMIYTNPNGSLVGDGCTAYMKYENFLRSAETFVGSVVGVDGGIDAVRKSLYRPMAPDQLPDFVLPLKVVEQGFRVVYESRALLREQALAKAADEYRMRVRVTLRALWALWDMRHLLTFSRPSLYAFQLWSHKVLRYLCFLFLIVACLANVALWSHGGFFKLVLLVQTTAYLAAVVSPMLERFGVRFKLMYLIRYFVLINLASVHAFVKFLRGQKQVIWQPRKG